MYVRMFPDDPQPPGHDWLVALVWACLAAACVGFCIGVVFAILELVR